MKPILTALLFTFLFNYTNAQQIDECYISFKTATDLTAAEPDKLPQDELVKKIKTKKGEADWVRTAGYKVWYYNAKQAPFVTLKVKHSDSTTFANDKKNILENLETDGMNPNAKGCKFYNQDYNGYKVYGMSGGNIEKSGIIRTFVFFPGDGITVHIFFNGMKKEYRNFTSADDFKKQCNRFIDEYTKYLSTCK